MFTVQHLTQKILVLLVVADHKKMADLLQNQFSSVYSDPNSPHIKSPDFSRPHIKNPMKTEDFVITDDDILSAISDISCLLE